MLVFFVSEMNATCVFCRAEPATAMHTIIRGHLCIAGPMFVSSSNNLKAEVFCTLHSLVWEANLPVSTPLVSFANAIENSISSPLLNAGSFSSSDAIRLY